jgi:hypothetical protein
MWLCHAKEGGLGACMLFQTGMIVHMLCCSGMAVKVVRLRMCCAMRVSMLMPCCCSMRGSWFTLLPGSQRGCNSCRIALCRYH